MKIVFDHQIFALQQYGGISRYFCRLSQELLKLDQEVHISARFYINKYLAELPPRCSHGRQIERFRSRFRGLLMAANRWQDANFVKRLPADILHETYYTNRQVNKGGARRILTVYDMIHERFNHESSAKDSITDSKKAACQAADHIICISHSTKRDLCDLFSIDEKKITVTHLGFDKFEQQRGIAPVVDRPYVLFVGKRDGYKNFESTVKAVGRGKSLKTSLAIVAFGGGAFTQDELRIAQECGISQGTMKYFAGGDDTLGALYRNALALVYPSLYEGFGLPPLEAMAHRCPVIASNTSSMPEVIGSAGVLFDPYDIDAQADSIERIVNDISLRQELITKGEQQLQLFSWKNCAKETLAVYQKT